MNKKSNELNELVDQIDEQLEKQKRALTMLVDKLAFQKGKAFAIKSEMGFTLEKSGNRVGIPSFAVVQTLDWAGAKVKMGSEMPFMQQHLDEKGRLIVNESIAESVKQRAPDWKRQPAIAAYLAHDKLRKFPTILAVLNPGWVDDPKHENWGKDGRALRSSYKFEAFDSKGQVGLIDLSDTLIYALDGQHRIMGIKGIQELQDKGFLQFKGKDGLGLGKNRMLAKEEFMEKFNLDTAEMQNMLTETITIELIPAVLAGETREEASRRIRSVFITINAYAQKAGKSETTLLDESNGFAIVARKAGTIHPLFHNDRVNWKGATLPQRTKWYTTLETLKIMAASYLSRVSPNLTEAWEPLFGNKQVPIRPDEKEIESSTKEFFEFLDNVAELPVFVGLESGDSLDEVRLFPGHDKKDEGIGKGHLLTRPIGQIILAKAVGELVMEGVPLKKIFGKLKTFDEEQGFSQHAPESIWFGVTYDFQKDKINIRANLDFGADLLKYMVQGAKQEERNRLLEGVVKARSTGKLDEHKWLNFKGKEKEYDPGNPIKGVRLPKPIS